MFIRNGEQEVSMGKAVTVCVTILSQHHVNELRKTTGELIQS
jgi:hypothetical protein